METDDLTSVREVKLAYENVKVVDCLDLSPEGCAAWEAALKRWALYRTCMHALYGVGVCILSVRSRQHILNYGRDVGAKIIIPLGQREWIVQLNTNKL